MVDMKKIFLICLSVSLLLASKLMAETPVEVATKSAESWLQLIDTGKYEESWQEAAPAFQKGWKKGKWKQTISAIREP
jgi:hypothetical protein